jgi:transcriptional regulator with XRE-family HTH domain
MIRAWREKRGLTQEEIAGLLGISASHLSRLENEERAVRPVVKVRVARALGAKVTDLFRAERVLDA